MSSGADADRATRDADGRVSYRVLVWLAVATFSMGIDGYVLTGLLPNISADLHVTTAAAGQLMTVFALTAALAGPVLVTVTGRWERRTVIVAALAVFVVGNLIVAVAPGYGIALGGRIVSALGGSLLNAAASAYVIAITPERHRGKALSFILGGWMVATALGVPVGLVIGEADWRFPLVMVAVVGAVALVGILMRLPRMHLPEISFAERLRPLRTPRLLAGLLVTVGILCSSYCCFTYATVIFEPLFHAPQAMIALLFGYGIASTLGNAFSGRLADTSTPVRTLSVLLLLLLIDAVFGFAMLNTAVGVMAAAGGVVWFLIAGIGNGGAAVPQQARLGSMAPDSVAVVMALNGSAISLGSALGSGLGGVVLAAGVTAAALPGVAAVILAGTVILHLLVARTRSVVAR
ncbi:MFS transporter [Humibacter antri]